MTPGRTVAFEFGQHVRGDLHLPPAPVPPKAPLVVMVPGGGWTSADPAGLVPLANRLAASGLLTATTTYRVGTDARFPEPVADILCAVDTAAAQTRANHIMPRPIVVLGHSAGAQLAAIAALTGSRFRAPCPTAAARIDALIGLAGPYDIARFADVAQPLLGTTPTTDPERWRAANPLTWASEHSEIPALLASGTNDNIVPPRFTSEFGQALRTGGHHVRLLSIDGATHASIYQPNVIAAPLIAWIRSLTPST